MAVLDRAVGMVRNYDLLQSVRDLVRVHCRPVPDREGLMPMRDRRREAAGCLFRCERQA